ncbi:DUF6331 family protein [Aquabacterium humicola]|uniref:DUF6331 family protein n=1 Tax=Aquabacterium humicola TaxID=3237377 RepID=UPI00254343EA|nr:DUF6331 family protein [Rubrivivax pictus]
MSEPPRPPKNAIPLGPGRWINYVDVSDRRDSAVEVDPWLKDLEPMWRALETECVADCCGIGAFDFYPQNIHAALQFVERADLCRELGRVRYLLGTTPGEVLVSKRLNNYFDRSVFLALLNHLQEHVCQAANDA